VVAIGHGIMPRAEPGCGGRPYFITQHCVSGRLGQIEADDEPEALSLMLKTGTVGPEGLSGEKNQLCFAGGLEKLRISGSESGVESLCQAPIGGTRIHGSEADGRIAMPSSCQNQR